MSKTKHQGFVCLLMQGSGSVQILTDPDQGTPNKLKDPDQENPQQIKGSGLGNPQQIKGSGSGNPQQIKGSGSGKPQQIKGSGSGTLLLLTSPLSDWQARWTLWRLWRRTWCGRGATWRSSCWCAPTFRPSHSRYRRSSHRTLWRRPWR